MKNHFLVDEINEISKLLTRTLAQRIEKLEVSYAQGQLLLYLFEEEGQIQKHLSRQLGVGPATTVRILDRMERNDLIQRQSNAADRRVIHIFLTEKGKALCPMILSTWQEFEEELLILTNKPNLRQVLRSVCQAIKEQQFLKPS